MGTYFTHLPGAFPYVAELPVEKVQVAVEYLMRSEGHITHGSSFAVTSDVSEIGHRKLWLSETSKMRLERLGIL